MSIIFKQIYMTTKKKKEKKEEEIEKVEYTEEGAEEKIIKFQKKIKELKRRLERASKERDEYLLGWQRERADFINYKKTEEQKIKEKEREIKMEIFKKMLDILDNFEIAEKHLTNDLKDNKWVKGVLEIKNNLKELLKKEGVVEIEEKDIFNPELHEAVAIEESDEDDKILEVFQKGYYFGNKVLRPARVKVGKKNN